MLNKRRSFVSCSCKVMSRKLLPCPLLETFSLPKLQRSFSFFKPHSKTTSSRKPSKPRRQTLYLYGFPCLTELWGFVYDICLFDETLNSSSEGASSYLTLSSWHLAGGRAQRRCSGMFAEVHWKERDEEVQFWVWLGHSLALFSASQCSPSPF